MDLCFVENGWNMPPVEFDTLQSSIQHNGLRIKFALNQDKTIACEIVCKTEGVHN